MGEASRLNAPSQLGLPPPEALVAAASRDSPYRRVWSIDRTRVRGSTEAIVFRGIEYDGIRKHAEGRFDGMVQALPQSRRKKTGRVSIASMDCQSIQMLRVFLRVVLVPTTRFPSDVRGGVPRWAVRCSSEDFQ